MTDADPALPGAVLAPAEIPFEDATVIEDNVAEGMQACEERIPPRYSDAVVSVPEVAAWVETLVEGARQARKTNPRISRGPSLLLVGGTGSGKTHQAYGAVRALAASGARCSWQFTTAADLYASLRPRQGFDSERAFERVAEKVTLLLLDDLGAAKPTEWNEEVNYRLINRRYELELPTVITTNLLGRQLSAALGDRVVSRLVEMATRVQIAGPDRRMAPSGGSAA